MAPTHYVFLPASLIRDAGEVTALSSEPRTMVGSGFVPCNYRRSESLWHLDLNKFQWIIIGQDKNYNNNTTFFHVLAIVNRAAMNTGVHVPF